MYIERIVRIVAGSFVLISLLLAHFHNQNWLWVTGFVGLNLFQSGFTQFCPLFNILDKLGVPRFPQRLLPEMSARVTILCDNTVGPIAGTLGEHGFSALIEWDGGLLLFDTGGGETLLHNAAADEPQPPLDQRGCTFARAL